MGNEFLMKRYDCKFSSTCSFKSVIRFLMSAHLYPLSTLEVFLKHSNRGNDDGAWSFNSFKAIGSFFSELLFGCLMKSALCDILDKCRFVFSVDKIYLTQSITLYSLKRIVLTDTFKC